MPRQITLCHSFRRAMTLVAALAIAFAVSVPARAQDKDPLLAKVNGVEIRQSDLTLAEEDLGQEAAALPHEAKREQIIRLLADIILVSQEAERQKVQDTDSFKQRYAMLRKKLLMGLLLRDRGKAAATEDAMRKVYDDAIKQIPTEEEAHARHILFRVADAKDEKESKAAEKKAKDVIARLKKGEDFAKLAMELTEDPSGKANGGDLGYFGKDQMVSEFSEVAFKLKKGELSEPVKTQFGWHVIKLEDKRTKPQPDFEQVKSQLESHVIQSSQVELITKLRKDAKIEKFYETEKPADDKEKKPAEPEKK